jgi:phosphoserine/homoserine phosphotransferase
VENKANPVKKFQKKGFTVVVIGDSYNDIDMLQAGDEGILFNASTNIKKEYPQFPVFDNYRELKAHLSKKTYKRRDISLIHFYARTPVDKNRIWKIESRG